MKEKIFAVIALALAVFGVYLLVNDVITNHILTPHYLSKETRYAVSSSVHYIGGKSGRYRYTFYIEHREYDGASQLLREGYHYFIKFYPPNPKYNEATKIVATRKDIENMPPDGYATLPHEQIVIVPMPDYRVAKIIFFSIIGLSLAFVLYKNVQYDVITPRRLAKEMRYAITNDVKPSFFNKNQYQKYSFSVGNRKYCRYTMGGLSGGNHYFIRFYPPNPRYNEPTFITATQQDIDNMPPDGYLILPRNEYLNI